MTPVSHHFHVQVLEEAGMPASSLQLGVPVFFDRGLQRAGDEDEVRICLASVGMHTKRCPAIGTLSSGKAQAPLLPYFLCKEDLDCALGTQISVEPDERGRMHAQLETAEQRLAAADAAVSVTR